MKKQIQVLSRGIKMSYDERDKIAPSLATFASLFSHLLVTIHDTEFYQQQSSSSQPHTSLHRWMPFTLSQLVPMALALRDVALGLVELAFPESRPAVRGRYIGNSKSNVYDYNPPLVDTEKQWEAVMQEAAQKKARRPLELPSGLIFSKRLLPW